MKPTIAAQMNVFSFTDRAKLNEWLTHQGKNLEVVELLVSTAPSSSSRGDGEGQLYEYDIIYTVITRRAS